MTVDVIINGAQSRVESSTTVYDVVRSLTSAENGVAVALNDEVVPRADWSRTVISQDDRVDVLTAVPGG